MTEETKECNCVVCKFLKSEGLKKFAAVTLASFIGCSLAILAFAPKKHHPHPKRPHAPYMRVMDRPMPPQGEFRHIQRHGGPEFRGEAPRRHEFRGESPCKKDFRGEHKKLPPDVKPVKVVE
ncbi:MAG: hypothetical protein NC390_06930 [Fusobacterium sp.]|nr:hypothetical protein [Fusobacterium sp.]